MRIRALLPAALLALATSVTAQVSDGVFDAQIVGTTFAMPWVDVFDSTGFDTTIEPFNNFGFSDDGFPTSGTQWGMLVSYGPAPAAPSGGGLHPVGSVTEIRQIFTVDPSGMFAFDWAWTTGESVPTTFYNDFASVDLIDPTTGLNLANLLYVDTGTAAAPINIPGATVPLTFTGTAMAWLGFGNEVAPTGPKTAAYNLFTMGFTPGQTVELRIICGNNGDNAVASVLYIDTITPSTLPPPPINQPNTPRAGLVFSGASCSGPGVYPAERTIGAGSGFTMTTSTGPSGSQPFAIVFGTMLAPGMSFPPYGIVNLDIGQPFSILLNGVVPGSLFEQLLGRTDGAGSSVIPLVMPPGTTPGIFGTFQGLVVDPTLAWSYNLTAATRISVSSGIPAAAIGSTVMAQGDDTFVYLPFTTFQFPFYGSVYTDVYVNSNGNITFGAGDPSLGGSPSTMATGSPRISPWWDDLNPGVGGAVAYTETPTSLSVSWIGVPEFYNTGSNDFAIQLDATGLITMSWGAMDATGGLIGISAGGANPYTTIDISGTYGAFVGGPGLSFFEQFSAGHDLGCTPISGVLTIVPNPYTLVPGDQGYSF